LYVNTFLIKGKSFFGIFNNSVDEKKRRKEMIPQIKKILYATDLSKNSSYAFFYAVDMAKRYKASIVILHVVEAFRQYMYTEWSIGIERVLQKARKEEGEIDLEKIKKHLQNFCQRTETQIGPPCVELVSNILVPLGYPVEEILKAADKESCDAIVLGRY